MVSYELCHQGLLQMSCKTYLQIALIRCFEQIPKRIRGKGEFC